MAKYWINDKNENKLLMWWCNKFGLECKIIQTYY